MIQHESIVNSHTHQFDIYENKSYSPTSLFTIHFRGYNWMQGGEYLTNRA